jgi:hypothetical protein
MIKSCVAVLLLLLACYGCNTAIGKILEDPRSYDGRLVTVTGQVTEYFSFVLIKYFVLKDKTGEIAVLTTRPLPREGSTIKIQGTVNAAFSIADRQLIVIAEKEKDK